MPSKSINKTLGGLTVRLYVNKKEQAKAQRLLDKMPNIYNKAFERASKEFGEHLVRLVKKCLAVGQPPPNSGVSWKPHSESTIHNLGAHPLLNLTGTYMNSIGIQRSKGRTWVGLKYNRQGGSRNAYGRFTTGQARVNQNPRSKLTLNQIAIINEFGSKDGKIPARPLWRPAWKSLGGNAKYQETLKKELQKELRRYM